mgnify:CR=1 FL=1
MKSIYGICLYCGLIKAGGHKYNNMYDIRFRNHSLGNGTKLVQAEMDN